NLDQLITKTIGVPCYVADDPLRCVVRGTGKVLDNLDIYKKTILATKK
ncbi:MAG: rod shape-determining protein, partial [Patescibacteria group bacterium]